MSFQPSGGPRIRRYRESDLAAVYDVCVRTADGGGDARGKYRSDDLMPDLFAGPYVYLEPEFAFVLDDGERAVGYVIGTPDTAAFARAYRERWIPRLADRYPAPPAAAATPATPATPDEEMLALHFNPERMIWPGLAAYPAHLHIDLLPPFQHAGHGRALMETFFAAAAAAGAGGVHVVVVATNTGALAFYDRLGFIRVPYDDPGPVVYLGRALNDALRSAPSSGLPVVSLLPIAETFRHCGYLPTLRKLTRQKRRVSFLNTKKFPQYGKFPQYCPTEQSNTAARGRPPAMPMAPAGRPGRCCRRHRVGVTACRRRHWHDDGGGPVGLRPPLGLVHGTVIAKVVRVPDRGVSTRCREHRIRKGTTS